MKVLHYSFYVSIDNDVITKIKTGYGYMVMDIVSKIKKTNKNTDIITLTGITNRREISNVLFISNNWFDFIRTFKIKHIKDDIKVILKNKVSFHEVLRIVFSSIQREHIYKVSESYDIVHFHGVGPGNIGTIKYFSKMGKKIIVTLHGLNSFDPIVNITSYANKVEKDFITFASQNNIPVTVISSGVKKDIISFLKGKSFSNFKVLINGTEPSEYNQCVDDIRKKYNISKNAKIAICVGNVCERKNQIQVVDAYNKLSVEIKENLYIIFIGHESEPKKVSQRVTEFQLDNRLILVGAIPKNEMSSYYDCCDFTILASISEGFGLSIIEGFQYGKPSLTFSDIDAIDDVYSDKCILKVENRTSSHLAKGIEDMLETKWDSDEIYRHSNKFTLSEMAENYINIYNEIK